MSFTLPVVLLEHRGTQYLGSVHVIALGQELHAFSYSFGSFLQSFPFRILAQQPEHFFIVYCKLFGSLRIIFFNFPKCHSRKNLRRNIK